MLHRDTKAKVFILGPVFVLALLALNVHADPIGDGALAPYRAGWFDNNGTLTCAQTCKTKAPGSQAEHEASAVPNTKRAFVCRVAGRPAGTLQTALYGSQFDERPACYTTGLDLKGSHRPKYFCLCVVK